MENIYTQNGYENRDDYLQCVAEDYGIDEAIVRMMADLLGPNEDFDGLISAIADLDESGYFVL